jgi:trehalose synthase
MYRVQIDSERQLHTESLSEQDRYYYLSPFVRELCATAHKTPKSRRLYHVSSTDRGGGVAEMLPKIIAMSHELGFSTDWLVMTPANELKGEFFSLTKHLHNNLHGDGAPLGSWSGCGLENKDLDNIANDFGGNLLCTQEMKKAGIDRMRTLYESVCTSSAQRFFESFCPLVDVSRDVIVIHDPQPAGMILYLKKVCPLLKTIWRCHVGVDIENEASRGAWAFLLPYVSLFDRVVFTCEQYVPVSLKAKAVIISPAISPLSAKNRELSAFEIVQTLTRAGLMGYEQTKIVLDSKECELIDPPYPKASLAKIYHGRNKQQLAVEDAALTDSEVAPAACNVCIGAVAPNEGIPFLHVPVVTQISRWDRLKGWKSLLLGFADIKARIPFFASMDFDASSSSSKRLRLRPAAIDLSRREKILRNSILVLAGPEPSGVSDDPEGAEVLNELKNLHDKLPAEIADAIKIVELPMQDVLLNAMCVNAIQRASLIVVQNSLREGFGLTLTEAMYKGIPCIGTQQAVGLKTQIVHESTGLLVEGDPSEPLNVAIAIARLLCDEPLRARCSVNGQKSAVQSYLVYKQLEKWLQVGSDVFKDCFDCAS